MFTRNEKIIISNALRDYAAKYSKSIPALAAEVKEIKGKVDNSWIVESEKQREQG